MAQFVYAKFTVASTLFIFPWGGTFHAPFILIIICDTLLNINYDHFDILLETLNNIILI